MITRFPLWLLITMLAHPQARHAAATMPVPDAAWRPVTRAGRQDGASDLIAVKRASSAAHRSREARVMGVIGGQSAEMLLALGANQLVFPAGSKPTGKEDYLSRACWFNGQGQPVRQILLLESRLAEPSGAAMEALLAAQRDFDVIDAARLMVNPLLEGENLQLGEARYGVILVAPSDFWPEDTLDLLLEFVTARGKVIFLGRQPLSIQRLLLRSGVVRVSETIEDIERGLNYAITRDFHAVDAQSGEPLPMIRYQHRSDGRHHYFFVFNSDREHATNVRFGIGAPGTIEEWDLWTGLITPMRIPVKEIPAGGTVALVVAPVATVK